MEVQLTAKPVKFIPRPSIKGGARRSLCVRLNQNESLSLPLQKSEAVTPLPLPTPTFQKGVLNLNEFRLRWALKKIVRHLHGLAVPLKNTCQDATEEWDKKSGGDEHEEESPWLLRHSNWLNRLAQLLLFLTYMLACWYVSVSAVFELGSRHAEGLAVWTAFIILDVVLTLNTVKLTNGKSLRTRKKIAIEYLKNQCGLDVGMLIFIIASAADLHGQTDFLLNILALCSAFLKFRQKGELLRSYMLARMHVLLLDTFLLILAASHTFAIVLYLPTKLHNDNNWLKFRGISESSWSTKYLYSVYWAVTTIATIGYGDITPQNESEILVTIVVELAGSALFGYFINIIGASMAELKKERQSLQEELSIADKLTRCLPLGDDLSYELKSYLKDNKKIDAYFSLNDERRIWQKLRPSLKERILQETNVRVVKKCLFFLTNFTRNIQDAIALKLVKRVFQPRERLSGEGQRNIYVVNQGSIEVHVLRQRFNKVISKTLRVIEANASVSANLFGYTEMLLRRKVNLAAVSRDFIVAYELAQHDFEYAVAQQPTDFESVCEMRDKIITSTIPQSFEGPELLDPRRHFVPLRPLIIRKASVRNTAQPRRRVARTERRLLAGRYDELLDSVMEGDDAVQVGYQPLRSASMDKQESLLEEEAAQERAWQGTEIANFDQVRSFTKYFVKSNLERLLEVLNPTGSQGKLFLKMPSRNITWLSTLKSHLTN